MSTSHMKCQSAGKHICQEPSGKVCVESGCEQPAGTWWTPIWCPDHDQERLDRVTSQLEALVATMTNLT